MHDGLDDVTMRPTQIRVHKLQLELEDNHINHVCIKQEKIIMVWCRSWSFCTRRTESDYAINSGPHNGEWFGHVNREGKVEKRVLTPLFIAQQLTQDVMTCRSKGSLQLLPPMTLNSDSLSIVAAAPRTQPVVHLGGWDQRPILRSLRRGALVQQEMRWWYKNLKTW